MALYLVQHGKSLSKEQDPERGLSEEGVSEVEQVAVIAARQNVPVSQIVHSGKKRALQTAEIYARALQPGKGVMETDGLAPLDDVRMITKAINSEDNLMAVGHLPFMERLVSYLISGSTDKPVIKFQNGGIVCLDIDPDTGFWVIKWTLFPSNA
ncbi:MAG: phosphohistidine phosphatase SixA [Proteobacteria bacterium]|nr:phosphohistidine phosphatase SixA [Pseudomonadota bacterium]